KMFKGKFTGVSNRSSSSRRSTSNSSSAKTTSAATSSDKSSAEYQRAKWESLETNINLLNIVRGCGLFARSVIQAQSTSPALTSVYAALVSIINPWIEVIGELIVKRIISSFRRQYESNDKAKCSSTTKFIAHLVNQNVLHELIALQILVLLLENPSDDNVELAIGFVKECGQKLCQVNQRGLNSIFSTLKNLLNKSLNKLHENNQYTHMITLDACEPEPILDVFKYDEKYEEHEEQYNIIREMFFHKSSDDENKFNSSVSNDEGDGKKDNIDEEEKKQQTIIDETETNLVIFRRTIYPIIQSNINAEECANELLKMNLRPEQKMVLCQVILNSCAQQRTHEQFFDLLGQRIYQYEIVHSLENVKLRNVAKFFAHLLVTNSISWDVLRCIRLTKEDTTSSSRIFIKNVLLEVIEFLG
ncbi:unnamed protein product, partial [Rotaria sp. Silwood2]